MKSNPLAGICLSQIGGRINQEDNFLFDGVYLSADKQKQMSNHNQFFMSKILTSRVQLFAVSDGMGGHNGGEVASRVCVESLSRIENEIQAFNSIQEVVNYLQIAIAEINTIVCEMSHKAAQLKGMGATLVLFVICGNEYAVLNIGDSRAYYLSGNEIVQITKDNSEGQRMLDLGLLTRKELLNFPARKSLSRYIGYNQNGFRLQADVYYPIIEKGLMLLCSDGVSDALSAEQITYYLHSSSNLEDAGKALMNAVASTRNADNATIILIQLGRCSCGADKFN